MNPNPTDVSSSKIDISSLEAIIFDFDGTLVDSEPIWKSTFFNLFKKDYKVEIPQQILWENTGAGVDLSVLRISDQMDLKMSGTHVMQMTDNINNEMHRKILRELPLRDGVTKVFELAQSHNISMAVCTASTNELIDSYFEKLGMRGIFKTVVSTSESDTKNRKPSPFPYLETMRQLDVEPKYTIAIEDSLKGITSAMLAGIDTIAIHNPFLDLKELEYQPKFVVQDFLQVLALFSNE